MLAWIAAHPACEGVAISAPGYVNPHTGFIEMGGAIRKFDNFAIKRWLEQQDRLPVAIENDANCVLLAERWQGKAAEMSNFLVLTIGTGIGGAIFCNNQLVHGARFRAGEFGYMQTDRPGTRDVRRYSMNENCTLRVLRHRYAEHIGKALDDVTGEEIFDRYDAGDAACQRLVAEFFNGLVPGFITSSILRSADHFDRRRHCGTSGLSGAAANIWPGLALPTISTPSVTATMPA
jgi:beta-glucoside kinase